MKLTNEQLKQIIKEELSKVITENEDALKMNKFAKFMAMLEVESKQSVFYGLLKQINNGDIGSSKYKLFLKEFKNLVVKSYDVKFNGKSSESDLEVVKEIAKLVKEWKDTDNLDRQRKDKIMSLMFFRLPQLSPVK